MIAAFAVLIPLAIYLGTRYKTGLYTSVFVTGLVGEIIGYIGRIMLHQNPFSKNAFLTYLICLTLAPVFMTAAIYLTLSRIIVLYGENISFIRPRWYTFIFTGFDIAALAVQAAGGGIAAIAEESIQVIVFHLLKEKSRRSLCPRTYPSVLYRSRKEPTFSSPASRCKSQVWWPSSRSVHTSRGK